MTKIINVRLTCLRCGKVNDITLGLTNKEDDAIYTCVICKFIIANSWLEDIEEI